MTLEAPESKKDASERESATPLWIHHSRVARPQGTGMNIKIIEPRDLDRRYDVGSLTPSLGPVVVATLLEQHGHAVEVISEYVTKLTLKELESAELVGISINTYNAMRGYQIAKEVTKPVVFGGFHASLMPEESLTYGAYVIRGDGYSIVDLAEYLHKGKIGNIRKIDNLVYRSNGKIVFNASQTRTINIVPNFKLVKHYHRLNVNRILRVPLLVNASRGCNYDCSFCTIKAVYPDVRKKDIAILLADIMSQVQNQHFLTRFLPRIIWITDDNFFADKKWAKSVLTELARLRTNHRFVIQARPDIAHDDDLLLLMKKARIGIVYLGMESLDQKSLENFKKDLVSDDIIYAVRKIKEHGMDVHGLFVFGDDEFKKGDGHRVFEFATQHGLSGVVIQPLTPFPGTKLFEELKRQGRILHQEWRHYNGKVVFEPKKLSCAELQEEVRECYMKVFSFLRVMRFLLRGPRGFRLAGLGEGMFRRLEARRMQSYAQARLDGQTGFGRAK